MNCQYYDFSRLFFHLLVIYIHLAVGKQNDIKILIEQNVLINLKLERKLLPFCTCMHWFELYHISRRRNLVHDIQRMLK